MDTKHINGLGSHAKQIVGVLEENMMEAVKLLKPDSFSVIDFEHDSLIAGLKLSDGCTKKLLKRGVIDDPGFNYATVETPFKGKLKLFDTHGSSIYATDFSAYQLADLVVGSYDSFLGGAKSRGLDLVEDGFHVSQINDGEGGEPCFLIIGTGNPPEQRREEFERSLKAHTCGAAVLDYGKRVMHMGLEEVKGVAEVSLEGILGQFREAHPEVSDTELRSAPVVSLIVQSVYSDLAKRTELAEPEGMVRCQVIDDNGDSTALCVPVSQD